MCYDVPVIKRNTVFAVCEELAEILLQYMTRAHLHKSVSIYGSDTECALSSAFQEKKHSKYRALSPSFSERGKRLLYLLPRLSFLSLFSSDVSAVAQLIQSPNRQTRIRRLSVKIAFLLLGTFRSSSIESII